MIGETVAFSMGILSAKMLRVHLSMVMRFKSYGHRIVRRHLERVISN